MYIFKQISSVDSIVQNFELNLNGFFCKKKTIATLSTFPVTISLLKLFLTGLSLSQSLLSHFRFLSHLWGHVLFLQGEQILALLLPFCFYRKPHACCPRLWSTIVHVYVFSQSFTLLIGWLGILYEFYVGFFFHVWISLCLK